MGRAQEPAWSKHAAQVLSRGQRDQVTQQRDSPPIPRAPFPLHALAGQIREISNILWTKTHSKKTVGVLKTQHDFIRSAHIQIPPGKASHGQEAVLGQGHYCQ